MDNNTDTQRFKIILPIMKTRTEIRKDEKGNEQEVRFVQGVASSTDKDLHGDRMAESAIKSMAESLKFHDVPLNADHDTTWSAEIGPIRKLEVSDSNDLILEAELSEMSKANDLWYALTKQNKKLGLSIGGYVKEYEMVKEEETDEEGNVSDSNWYRLYKEIDLDHVAVTSSPANPKTWVSAISKSIDPKKDLEMIKAIEEKHSTTDKRKNDKDIKALAHKIARKVQDIEADLLLELTESVLLKLDPRQIEKVEDYLNLLERNMSMDAKDVSLEAEEAKKADATATPDGADENSAALENESPDNGSDDKAAGTSTPDSEGQNSDADKGEADPKDGAKEDDADKSDENADGSGQSTPKDNAGEDNTATPDADAGNGQPAQGDQAQKSDSQDIAQVIKDLTENLKVVVKTNEELTKRLEELEDKPAERKAIAISKDLGDDDSEEESDAENLKKAMDKEIADARVKYAQDPTLFSRIQKIRAEYAMKAQGISK